MKGLEQNFTVLLDEGAPQPVAVPLLERGHQVIYHSEVLQSGATDDQVVVMAVLNSAILIAVDADMKRLVRRFGSFGSDQKYKKLNLLFLTCNAGLVAKRLAHCLSLVEHEWQISREKSARRFWVDIGNHRITSYR